MNTNQMIKRYAVNPMRDHKRIDPNETRRKGLQRKIALNQWLIEQGEYKDTKTLKDEIRKAQSELETL